ncbi:MAG: aldehyde dehydrogenase family protein [Candidatus Woesearchaeota archaeon]
MVTENKSKGILEKFSSNIDMLKKAGKIIEDNKSDLISLQIENTAIVKEFSNFDISQLIHIWKDTDKLIQLLYDKEKIDLSERRGIGKTAVLLPSDAIMPFGLVYLAKALYNVNMKIKPSTRTRPIYNKLEQLFKNADLKEFFINEDGSNIIDYLKRGDEFLFYSLNPDNGFKVIQIFGSDNYITPTIEKLIVQNKGLEKLILEGPGNNEFIVTGHLTEIDRCAKAIVDMATINSGQVCQATGIVYVDQKILSKLLPYIIKYASEKKLGDPRISTTNIGPIRKEIAMNAYLQVQDAILKGAHIAYVTPNIKIETEVYSFIQKVGKTKEINIIPPVNYTFKSGYSFFPLIVLTDVKDNMRVQREEKFAPLIAIQTFNYIDELYNKINNNRYGLNAVVFGDEYKYQINGRNPQTSPLIHTLQNNVGQIFINTTILDQGSYDVLYDTWGGYKNSRFMLYGAEINNKRVLIKDQIGPGSTILDFTKPK